MTALTAESQDLADSVQTNIEKHDVKVTLQTVMMTFAVLDLFTDILCFIIHLQPAGACRSLQEPAGACRSLHEPRL
jgi:hypothetical protein